MPLPTIKPRLIDNYTLASRDLIAINMATFDELMAMNPVTAMDLARCCADPDTIAKSLLECDVNKHTTMIYHGLNANSRWENLALRAKMVRKYI